MQNDEHGLIDRLPVQKCGHCPALVAWVSSINNRPTPIDPVPRDDGNAVLEMHGDRITLVVLKKGQTPLGDPPRFVTHFVTCPGFKATRTRNERKRPNLRVIKGGGNG